MQRASTLLNNLKTIINRQYDNNVVIDGLKITFCLILLCSIKIHNCDSYDQMNYMVQSKYIHKAKIEKHRNSKLSLFMSFNM